MGIATAVAYASESPEARVFEGALTDSIAADGVIEDVIHYLVQPLVELAVIANIACEYTFRRDLCRIIIWKRRIVVCLMEECPLFDS